jgi:hypothetical protein
VPEDRGPPAAERRRIRALAPLLLALPVAAWIVPSLYARTSPKLGALPFFLWYQIAASIGTGIVIAVVFLARKRERPSQ